MLPKNNFAVGLWAVACLLVGNPVAVVADNSSCHLDKYDTAPLTKSYWAVKSDRANCPEPQDCTFFFSMCFNASDVFLQLCPANSAACVHYQDGTAAAIAVGPPVVTASSNSFLVIYLKDQQRTTLTFQCDPQAQFKTEPENLVSRINSTTVHKNNNNEYSATVKYAGACEHIDPPPPPPPAPSSGGMGPGGQLFVILLVMALLYFGGGIAYNHVNGARGIELLPHHWFWTNFPSYVVDGCLFLVRVVTCQPRPTYQQNGADGYGSTGGTPAGVSPSGRSYETL